MASPINYGQRSNLSGNSSKHTLDPERQKAHTAPFFIFGPEYNGSTKPA
ncbi:hypothetical protein AAKU67_003487 [Oxalobacteraceae bacterium GrIS 2.11]